MRCKWNTGPARFLPRRHLTFEFIHSCSSKKFLPNHFHATKVTPDVRPRERKKNFNASVSRIRTASGDGRLYLKALKTWLPSTRNEIDSDTCVLVPYRQFTNLRQWFRKFQLLGFKRIFLSAERPHHRHRISFSGVFLNTRLCDPHEWVDALFVAN